MDIPLNEYGLAHAAGAAAALVDVRPTAILSSDLSRASSTASMLSRADRARRPLRRAFARALVRAVRGADQAGDVRALAGALARWRRGEEVAEVGIEPRADVGERVVAAVTEAAEGLEGDDVLVVGGHGSALAAGVTMMVGLGPAGWYGIAGMDNCHWAVLRAARGRTPDWVLTSYNVGVL